MTLSLERKAATMGFRIALFGAAILASTVGQANVDYPYPDFVTHRIEGRCFGEPISASFSTWDNRSVVGLKEIKVGTRSLPPGDLRLITKQLNGAHLVKIAIVGCRKTKQGDYRVWFSAESEHPDPTTTALPVIKSFFVRNGCLEFHDRAPVD